MSHCARCRADAVGQIDEGISVEGLERLNRFAHPRIVRARLRPHIAVATQEGALVNLHLGEAANFILFKQDQTSPSGFRFVEVRKAPEPGNGDSRWQEMADLLHDCRAILVTAAGPKPTGQLASRGIEVVEMEGLIEEGLRAVFSEQPLPASLRRRFTSCGTGGCKGTGTGCG